MRRFLIRAILLAILPLGISISPASAQKDVGIPWGCELLRNTMCHCLSPSGLMECMIMP